MILSVSRRTDIPAFYSEWFFNRIKAGYVMVRNPMNYRQVSRISLDPALIDCIVFWTKDPSPMMDRLDLLSAYRYYFLITLNPYGPSVERNTPSPECALRAFRQLSARIGRERVIWRYDPIIFNDEFDLHYHRENFRFIASNLEGYTKRCQISFVDFYKKAASNLKALNARKPDDRLVQETGKVLQEIGGRYGIGIEACAERVDLSQWGIRHAKCIDDRLVADLAGQEIKMVKDKNQRHHCGCVSSIDIGAYNSCGHGCLYCYANFSDKASENNRNRHDPQSPLLIGNIEAEDKITDRKMVSFLLESEG